VSHSASTPADIWTELYDPKEGRKLRQIPHENVDIEQLYRIARSAQNAEKHARERADRYWKMLQQYQGKLAVLKHENNQLRKKLRVRQEELPSPPLDAVACMERVSQFVDAERDRSKSVDEMADLVKQLIADIVRTEHDSPGGGH